MYNSGIKGEYTVSNKAGSSYSFDFVSVITWPLQDGFLLRKERADEDMALARIRAHIKLRPASNQAPPPTTNIRQYIFGHSLINHSGVGEANDLTNILIWIQELADTASNTHAFSMQFGQGATHVANLPPVSQLGVLNVNSAWNSGTFDQANFNTVMFTPANFRQDFAANAPNANWSDITTETTATLFDWTAANTSNNLKFIIYENWADMGSFTTANFTSTFPTSGELTTYWNHVQTTWHSWWTDYQDVMLATRSDLDIKMIPVGAILGKLLLGTLSSVTPQALYEDSAPHGRPSLYFLAGLITYMGTYGVIAPNNYVVPITVDPIIAANYSAIITEIWNELLAFNYPSTASRVF